jgi:hypothetical protein
MTCCLVAIAKNEARFLIEWIAHYLALGVDRIFLFDNDSTDDTEALVAAIATTHPVSRIAWPTPLDRSPQIAAYAYATRKLIRAYDWTCFFDCDEFLVLRKDRTIGEFLARYGPDVGALAINWLTFGSSGLIDSGYDMVTETFRRGGPRRWTNNKHFKTIVRSDRLRRMGVHVAEFDGGAYVHPDGKALSMPRRNGLARRIDHSLAQLNHYQLKSQSDFHEKVGRGRAGKKPTDATRFRLDPDGFFAAMDRNDVEYRDIDNLRDERMRFVAAMRTATGAL